MRKLLIVLLLILALVAWWLWRGRDLVTLADQFELVETRADPIDAIAYNGEGSGGAGRMHRSLAVFGFASLRSG